MALTASTNTRTLVPTGNYFAAVIGVYDIGTQPSDKYEPSHQIIVSFELHKKKGVVLDRDGNPMQFNRFMGLGLGINKTTKQPSHLRQICEAILRRNLTPDETRGFDVLTLVGKTCRLTINHTEDGTKELPVYAPMDEDDPELDIENRPATYELDPAKEVPDTVPEWVGKFVQKSLEWTKASKSQATTSALKADSPF
jgi:hypothetical protein